MDVASRFPIRARTGSYRDGEGQAMPDDSGGESESNGVRRKFQRTTGTTDPEPTFRKPSLPASATRGSLERAPSLNARRKSTLRETLRVPSGPREYPSSPGKQRGGPGSSVTPTTSTLTTAPSAASLLPSAASEPYLSSSRLASSHRRQDSFGSGRPSLSNDAAMNAAVSNGSGHRAPGPLGDSLDFLPDVNFDDFQTSIKNYDGTSPLLSDFPSVDGGRILPKESLDRGSRPMATQSQQVKNESLGRAQSLRQRLAGGRKASGSQAGPTKDAAAQSSVSSLRDRRQSSITQTSSSAAPVPAASAGKAPRKSVGPGLLSNMVRGASGQQPPESSLKPALARTSSLSKARRSTIQPSASAGAELPRVSTFTSTTQSRRNKVKSLQPPPRDSQEHPNTPASTKSTKSSNNGAHTPSSSGGNRRQSMASGRASGLGARTISPTDARRLRRMSTVQAPPMPIGLPKAHTPTPQDEIPNPMLHLQEKMPELPRFAQPSPSLIPRKASAGTPSSNRASPERQLPPGGISLSSKSSYQSLVSSGLNGSTSRLPTPKPRSANQSGSSMDQYVDNYGESEADELVPPVPAIPKAYESPKDLDNPSFFSTSLKSSQSAFSDMSLDGNPLPTPRFLPTPRTSFDVPSEPPRKHSGELPRMPHTRSSTLSNGTSAAAFQSISARPQPDPNGRKNANLQPLRLPPLNLGPIGTRAFHSATNHPRPSQELDSREDWMTMATPEPKRNAKTPSTPMTASKATFFSRKQDDTSKALRSSSSHYALRDAVGTEDGRNISKFWDESDNDSSGVPIPGAKQTRSTITPFASGSLPKSSGEFAGTTYQTRPSGDYGGVGEYGLSGYDNGLVQNSSFRPPRTRAQTNTTINSMKSGLSIETSAMSVDTADSPTANENVKNQTSAEKKEKDGNGVGSGLRRKLSLGWKRSGSKAANHADNVKGSPQQETHEKEEKVRSRLQKRNVSGGQSSIGSNGGSMDMPPPKLPASATWTGDVSTLSSSARPSLDTSTAGQSFHARRKSQVPTSTSSISLVDTLEQPSSQNPGPPSTAGGNVAGIKTRSLHTDQPTPITSRASSWGNLGQTLRVGSKPAGPGTSGPRHKLSASTFSALVKDKDDLAADDEMQRLSRKRKDVDSAARESEDLKKRAIARSPVSAEGVLHDRGLIGGAVLNVFERGEVVDYAAQGIYFTGTRNAKKVVGSLSGSPLHSTSSIDVKSSNSGNGGSTNFGYDDERGDYNIVLGDHLAYRYEVVDILGKGSFGQVVRCVDHKDGGVVAVKIIRNKKRFHQQALVEVGILGRLGEWDPDGAYATLSITSSFYFRSHLCIVTPCLSINLYEFIRAHNFVGFSLPLIRRFSRQLLACLVLLQQKRIIHCDLKPENILLCEARKADVRVIDFGSSCREEEKVYTYIQSRFYRSPEVILGSSYGLGIDMWSLGCILAELWTGYPIFPGENEQEQLACIMEIFGPPDRHLVDKCTRKKLFFDSVGKPRVTVSSKGRRRRPSSRTLQQALKTEDEAFIDFIARCLRWDPDRRLKPSEAISHPFVTGQPWNQRSGIPDEARRAARVRSSAAVPAASSAATGGIPSPVKRVNPSNQSVATPGRNGDRTRGLPETPQTVLRNGVPTANPAQGSPVKLGTTNTNNRRHSTVATAGGAAAVAGSKRASNGAVLGSGVAAPPTSWTGTSQQQQQAARGASGNLAQMAAQQSMSATATAAGNSAGRWRG